MVPCAHLADSNMLLIKILLILAIFYVVSIASIAWHEIFSKGKSFKEVRADRRKVILKGSVLFLVFIIASIIYVVLSATSVIPPKGFTVKINGPGWVNGFLIILVLISCYAFLIYDPYLKEPIFSKRSFEEVYAERKKHFWFKTVMYLVFLIGTIYTFFVRV